MTAAEMEAIIGGYHGDAFGVLGPHPLNAEKPERGWVVRCFIPQARSATLLIEQTTNGQRPSVPMQKVHSDGFYAAELKSHPGSYRVEIEGWHGGKSIVEDPYRFGPILSEFDLHLHGEG